MAPISRAALSSASPQIFFLKMIHGAFKVVTLKTFATMLSLA